MKENKVERCPGCSRHCRRDNLHCKRGAAYFEKLERKEDGSARKWEKPLAPDGLAHRYLHTARGLKKRIARGKVSEEAFLAVLSEVQQTQLAEILNRLAPLARKKHDKGSEL